MNASKWTAILLLSAAVTAPALAKKDKAKTDAPAAASTSATATGGSQPAATVGGSVITMADLDKAASSQLAKVRQQEFQVRSDTLTAMIQEKLVENEAAARNMAADSPPWVANWPISRNRGITDRS